ncbi:MAG: MFS transporter [Salinibacterium sp.]|nr:MFS transporter [Salinibacterium sp.]
MTAVTRRPLWAGRVAAVTAIVLLAVNLRTAVAVLSPILGYITEDIPLDGVGIGFLGMLAPLAFAASGFVAPVIARRLGIELATVLACVAMVIGPLLRAVAPNYAVLVVGSVFALTGMGFANILLPPIIKKYFPDRVALLTSTYVTLMSISAAVPPLVAAPLAESAGWRVTVGVWAFLAAAALIPWLVVLAQHRGRARRQATEGDVAVPAPALLGRMYTSRVARALTLAFAVTSLNVYSLFAWLPAIVIDTADVTPSQAGALIALFGIIGLPLGLIAPVLASRVKNIGWVLAFGVACFVAGYVGLLVVPGTATWVWVFLLGTGPLVFAVSLVLINLRTRTYEGSIALSGFVQGIAYGLGALGPLVIGLLHDITGGWMVPQLFLLATSLLTLFSAVMLAKPSMVEDELAI